ncbi:MAG TPA: hypothetical protein VE569_14530 [Acidimicrobiia bacterium]|nr:hypothetical protein [Acidimicrobiia bacterium]
MTRFLGVSSLTGILFLVPAVALAAEDVTVAEIVEMSAELGGVEVTVEGELIGDYGFRGDGWMWTQLNGDVYVDQPVPDGGAPVGGNTGIGIRMPTNLGEGLDPPGGYRHRGPVVRVTGVWKYHDPERQGESYLEVQSLTVVESGRELGESANWTVIIVGALLLAAGVFGLVTSSEQ